MADTLPQTDTAPEKGTGDARPEAELVTDRDELDAIRRFLDLEAELLDDGRLRDWLDLVTPDVRYLVPVRIHKEQTGESRVTGVADDSFHLDEDLDSLQMRVDRIETGFAWAEEPPSRLRHHVGNVRVRAGERDDERQVRSNVLVFRSRWDRPEHDLLSAERRDVLRLVDGEWRLARRFVVLDHTVVPTLNLAFLF